MGGGGFVTCQLIRNNGVYFGGKQVRKVVKSEKIPRSQRNNFGRKVN